MDARASEDFGLHSTAYFAWKDLPLHPSNVNDSALRPSMTAPPEASTGFTDMTLALLRIQVSDLVIHESVYPIDTADAPRTKAVLEDRRQKLREANDRMFEQYFTSTVDNESYISSAARLMWKLSVAKGEFLLLFRALRAGVFGDDKVACDEVLRAACTVLENIPEVFTKGPLKQFSWYAKSYPQYYALGFVLQRLYQGEVHDAKLLEKARTAVEDSFATLEEDGDAGAVQRKGAVWVALSLLKDTTLNKLLVRKHAPTSGSEPFNTGQIPIATPPGSFEGSDPSGFDFNSLGDPLFDLADFDTEGDWSAITDFL